MRTRFTLVYVLNYSPGYHAAVGREAGPGVEGHHSSGYEVKEVLFVFARHS